MANVTPFMHLKDLLCSSHLNDRHLKIRITTTASIRGAKVTHLASRESL